MYPRVELREIIYGYCLVVNDIINPYPTVYERPVNIRVFNDNNLWLDLLLINRQIKEEAVPILYGRNRWVMPSMREHHETIFMEYGQLFRSVVFNLDFRDVNEKCRLDRVKDSHNTQLALPLATPQQRFEYLHEVTHIEMDYKFRRIHDLRTVTYSDLQNAVLDLSTFYCPIGCCRWEVLENEFRHWFATDPEYPNDSLGFAVKGLKTQQERDFVYKELGCIEG